MLSVPGTQTLCLYLVPVPHDTLHEDHSLQQPQLAVVVVPACKHESEKTSTVYMYIVDNCV